MWLDDDRIGFNMYPVTMQKADRVIVPIKLANVETYS